MRRLSRLFGVGLLIAAAAAFLATIFGAAAANAATPTTCTVGLGVTAPSQTLTVGQTINVQIRVNNLSGTCSATQVTITAGNRTLAVTNLAHGTGFLNADIKAFSGLGTLTERLSDGSSAPIATFHVVSRTSPRQAASTTHRHHHRRHHHRRHHHRRHGHRHHRHA